MSDEPSRAQVAEKTLEALERMLAERNPAPVQFTDEQADALVKIAKLWLAWETMGAAGAVIRRLLLWLAFMIAAAVAIRNGAIEFIQSAISSGKGP